MGFVSELAGVGVVHTALWVCIGRKMKGLAPHAQSERWSQSPRRRDGLGAEYSVECLLGRTLTVIN